MAAHMNPGFALGNFAGSAPTGPSMGWGLAQNPTPATPMTLDRFQAPLTAEVLRLMRSILMSVFVSIITDQITGVRRTANDRWLIPVAGAVTPGAASTAVSHAMSSLEFHPTEVAVHIKEDNAMYNQSGEIGHDPTIYVASLALSIAKAVQIHTLNMAKNANPHFPIGETTPSVTEFVRLYGRFIQNIGSLNNGHETLLQAIQSQMTIDQKNNPRLQDPGFAATKMITSETIAVQLSGRSQGLSRGNVNLYATIGNEVIQVPVEAQNFFGMQMGGCNYFTMIDKTGRPVPQDPLASEVTLPLIAVVGRLRQDVHVAVVGGSAVDSTTIQDYATESEATFSILDAYEMSGLGSDKHQAFFRQLDPAKNGNGPYYVKKTPIGGNQIGGRPQHFGDIDPDTVSPAVLEYLKKRFPGNNAGTGAPQDVSTALSGPQASDLSPEQASVLLEPMVRRDPTAAAALKSVLISNNSLTARNVLLSAAVDGMKSSGDQTKQFRATVLALSAKTDGAASTALESEGNLKQFQAKELSNVNGRTLSLENDKLSEADKDHLAAAMHVSAVVGLANQEGVSLRDALSSKQGLASSLTQARNTMQGYVGKAPSISSMLSGIQGTAAVRVGTNTNVATDPTGAALGGNFADTAAVVANLTFAAEWQAKTSVEAVSRYAAIPINRTGVAYCEQQKLPLPFAFLLIRLLRASVHGLMTTPDRAGSVYVSRTSLTEMVDPTTRVKALGAASTITPTTDKPDSLRLYPTALVTEFLSGAGTRKIERGMGHPQFQQFVRGKLTHEQMNTMGSLFTIAIPSNLSIADLGNFVPLLGAFPGFKDTDPSNTAVCPALNNRGFRDSLEFFSFCCGGLTTSEVGNPFKHSWEQYNRQDPACVGVMMEYSTQGPTETPKLHKHRMFGGETLAVSGAGAWINRTGRVPGATYGPN